MLASFGVSCGVHSVFQWVLSTLWVSGSVLGARATEMNKTHVYNRGLKEIRRQDGEMVIEVRTREVLWVRLFTSPFGRSGNAD